MLLGTLQSRSLLDTMVYLLVRKATGIPDFRYCLKVVEHLMKVLRQTELCPHHWIIKDFRDTCRNAGYSSLFPQASNILNTSVCHYWRLATNTRQNIKNVTSLQKILWCIQCGCVWALRFDIYPVGWEYKGYEENQLLSQKWYKFAGKYQTVSSCKYVLCSIVQWSCTAIWVIHGPVYILEVSF